MILLLCGPMGRHDVPVDAAMATPFAVLCGGLSGAVARRDPDRLAALGRPLGNRTAAIAIPGKGIRA